ncbi:MAG: deoxyguanosinetriphosphate triphosphohydrolase [Anaerolineae bacterium]
MLVTRERREEIEAQMLAPYATLARNSKGREHPEDEQDYRTAFQRDRDRIIHTTAFRRLEYKTQVFVNYEGDYYRTRLTHTLEVAQIGRSIARALGANEDLVEAICLVHDIGHSPFGHSGERVLNELMGPYGGFDHNKQTLRIVTKLERRYPQWEGLNLTFEVLEGIVKHESEYDIADAADYDPDTRGSLEAQICNIADELAYNAHDLDDGLRSGMLRVEQVAHLELWQMLCDSIGWDGRHFDDMIRYRLIRRMIGLEIDDAITYTSQKLAEANPQSLEELQRLPYNVIGHTEAFNRMNRELKDLLYSKLYRHYRVVRMAAKAERFITDLFNEYIRVPEQLPDSVQAQLEHRSLHRVVCDYIAGMTDRYALQEHQRLFDPFTRP